MKESVLQKFAELVERDVDTVKAEVEGLMNQQGLSEEGAFAVWKANNSMALRAGKPQDVSIRVLSRTLPKTRTIKTGESQVSDMEMIYTNSDNEVGWGYTSLWGDRAPLVNQVEVGKTYAARARFAYQPSKVKMNGFELKGEVDDDKVPSIADVVTTWEIGKLEDIQNFAGNTEMFKGTIGRIVIDPNKAGRVMGIEISSEDSLPVMCWAGRGPDNPAVPEVQELLQNLTMGDTVVVYGYVNEKPDGTVTLNAGGIFKV